MIPELAMTCLPEAPAEPTTPADAPEADWRWPRSRPPFPVLDNAVAEWRPESGVQSSR